MAELNLTQRAELKNNQRFQQRLHLAATKTANYWLTFPIATIGDMNVAMQKRKVLARKILAAGGVDSEYISTFVMEYNEPSPVLEDPQEPFDAVTNQLADGQLTDSSTSAAVYDKIARISAGDNSKTITL